MGDGTQISTSCLEGRDAEPVLEEVGEGGAVKQAPLPPL